MSDNNNPGTSRKTGHPVTDLLDELSTNNHWPNTLEPKVYTDIYDMVEFCGEQEEEDEQYLGWPL